MTSPPILLFDVMGTLVVDPFYERVPAFFGMTFRELLSLKHPTAWVEFETGSIDEAEFLPRFFRDGRAYDHVGLKAAMRDGYRWIDGMHALVQDLHGEGVPMHALSNYTPWYRMIEERTGLSRYVPWSFVSSKTGARKPDPEAYLGASRLLGVPAEECLFIDDRAVNCDAADAVGMPSILFSDAASLRTELVRRDVLR